MNNISRLRGILTDLGTDALIVSSDPGRLFASGFQSSAGLVIILPKSAYFLSDNRYEEAAKAEISDAEVLITSQERPYVSLVREIFTEHRVKSAGFEERYMSHARYLFWSKALKQKLVPASDHIAALRSVKTVEEIACIREAQRISEAAYESLLSEIRPGMTEREVASLLTYKLLSAGADSLSFNIIAASGENSSMPHARPTDRVLRSGDFLTLDFGTVHRGYHSDMTRTVSIGNPDEEMRRVYDTVLRAQEAGLSMIRAGASCRDVHETVHGVIRASGYGEFFGHGFGHGVGVEIHEEPTASPFSDSILASGAVMSAEPGIYLPGRFGVRIEDLVAVTESGYVNLNLSPKELLVL